MKELQFTDAQKTRIEIKSEFAELTVGEFVMFMSATNAAEGVTAQMAEEVAKSQDSDGGDALAAFAYDQRVTELDGELLRLRVEQIASLTPNPASVGDFLFNTKGVDVSTLKRILRVSVESMGDFFDWYDKIRTIKQFKAVDYRRRNWWRLTKINEFEVYSPARQTLLRDHYAQDLANWINDVENAFKRNQWDVLPKFLAFVCHPVDERVEIASDKRTGAKNAFVGVSDVEGLTIADRLALYSQRLDKIVNKRAKAFEAMPLPIAFGIYKQYFFLSRHLPRDTSQSIRVTSHA